MPTDQFSSQAFNFHGVSTSENKSSKNVEIGNGQRQSLFHGDEELGTDSLWSDHGLYHDDSWVQKSPSSKFGHQEQRLVLTPPLQTCLEEIASLSQVQNGVENVESKKDNQDPCHLSSFELIKSDQSGLKLLKKNVERVSDPSNHSSSAHTVSQEMSMGEIMRTAGARFMQTSSETFDVPSMLRNPFHLPFPGMSNEDAEKLQFTKFLLAAAEKVGNEQFDHARRILEQCGHFSSKTGHSVQRLVHSFSEALWERINIKTGKVPLKGLGNKQLLAIDDSVVARNPATLKYFQAARFCQMAHCVAMQAIVENLVGAKSIHLIDLSIRSGTRLSILMQALASQHEHSPLELLKITAIGTVSRQSIEDTGKRLTTFAQTLNLPFSFKVVMVSDFLEVKENMFELNRKEALVVYCGYSLWNLLSLPNRLDSIVRVIRNINPRTMVVEEIEANHNSPIFVHRFVDALFYFSTSFDYLNACMERKDSNRTSYESRVFGEAIKNIVATENDDRKIRTVKIDVWREFFARFGMLELELSATCLCQANLVTKKFQCGDFCTIDKDVKSIIIGWKGSPLRSVSAWKFQKQRRKSVLLHVQNRDAAQKALF